jgi:TrmH family RNA methyltransferase
MRRLTSDELHALLALLRPAGRRDAGRLLVPGYKCAGEYLRAGGRPDWLLVDADRREDAREAVGEAVWRELEARDRLCRLRDHELARLADQPSPEGLVLAGPRPARAPTALPPHLLLDGVQDPGNLGAMLRTALWFGLDRVWLLAPCADPWSPRGIRAGMGAVFHLADCRQLELDEFEERLPALGARLLGLDARAEAAVDRFAFQERDVLVLGSESHGLRLPDAWLTERLRIPGAGRAESLNVGHALAVCAWQRFRSRHA